MNEEPPSDDKTTTSATAETKSKRARRDKHEFMIYTRNGTVLLNTLDKRRYDFQHLLMLLMSLQQISRFPRESYLQLSENAQSDTKLNVYSTDIGGIVCSLFCSERSECCGLSVDNSMHMFNSFCVASVFTCVFKHDALKSVREKVSELERLKELSFAQYQYRFNSEETNQNKTSPKDLLAKHITEALKKILLCPLITPYLECNLQHGCPFVQMWADHLFKYNIAVLSLYDIEQSKWTSLQWLNNRVPAKIARRLKYVKDSYQMERILRYYFSQNSSCSLPYTDPSELSQNSSIFHYGKHAKVVVGNVGKFVLCLLSEKSIEDEEIASSEKTIAGKGVNDYIHFEHIESPDLLHELMSHMLSDVLNYSAISLIDQEDQVISRNPLLKQSMTEIGLFQLPAERESHSPPAESQTASADDQQSKPAESAPQDTLHTIPLIPQPPSDDSIVSGRRAITKRQIDRKIRTETLHRTIEDTMAKYTDTEPENLYITAEKSVIEKRPTNIGTTTTTGDVLINDDDGLKSGKRGRLVHIAPENLYI